MRFLIKIRQEKVHFSAKPMTSLLHFPLTQPDNFIYLIGKEFFFSRFLSIFAF